MNEYFQTDNEEQKDKKNLTWLWILLGVLGGLIIIGLIVFLIRKEEEENDKKRKSR